MRFGIVLVLSALLFNISADGVASAAGAGDKPRSETAQPVLRPHLVALSVTDLDAAIRWYCDVLGFREQRRLNLPDYKLRIGFLERDGFRLELIEFKDSVSQGDIRAKFPAVTDRARVQGFVKLAFAVPDIRKFAELLKARKAEFLRDVTRESDTGETWFMIKDMDGNVLQFFEVKPARPAKAPRTSRLNRARRDWGATGL